MKTVLMRPASGTAMGVTVSGALVAEGPVLLVPAALMAYCWPLTKPVMSQDALIEAATGAATHCWAGVLAIAAVKVVKLAPEEVNVTRTR